MSPGRDRVPAIRCSRSREPSLIKGRKYAVGFENAFTARGRAPSPVRGSSTAHVDAHGRLPDESARSRCGVKKMFNAQAKSLPNNSRKRSHSVFFSPFTSHFSPALLHRGREPKHLCRCSPVFPRPPIIYLELICTRSDGCENKNLGLSSTRQPMSRGFYITFY